MSSEVWLEKRNSKEAKKKYNNGIGKLGRNKNKSQKIRENLSLEEKMDVRLRKKNSEKKHLTGYDTLEE